MHARTPVSIQSHTFGAEAFQRKLVLKAQLISLIATCGGYYSDPIGDSLMLPTSY
jgi:hypothetical protein